MTADGYAFLGLVLLMFGTMLALEPYVRRQKEKAEQKKKVAK